MANHVQKLKQEIYKEMEKENVMMKFSSMVDEGIIDINGYNLFQKMIPVGSNIHLVKLNKEIILENPFLQNIQIPNIKRNEIYLGKKRIIPAGFVTAYLETYRKKDTLEQIHTFFYCDKNVRFPNIMEGDTNVSWMSVEPFEIESFRKFIEEAEGNVLLGGLGLGYVAYMLSEKKEVENITILEMNQDVISVFQENILPQFKNKDKIKVIHADAIKYLQENDLSFYNHINVDIWMDTIDMIGHYLKCLEVEKNYPNIAFSYWLEPELKESMQTSMLRSFSGYAFDFPFQRKIADGFMKQEKIRTKEDLNTVVNLDQFRDKMLNWYLEHKEEATILQKESNAMMSESLVKQKTMNSPFQKLF